MASFAAGSATTQPVLILSYEMYRKYAALLCRIKNGFLMCDEGVLAFTTVVVVGGGGGARVEKCTPGNSQWTMHG